MLRHGRWRRLDAARARRARRHRSTQAAAKPRRESIARSGFAGPRSNAERCGVSIARSGFARPHSNAARCGVSIARSNFTGSWTIGMTARSHLRALAISAATFATIASARASTVIELEPDALYAGADRIVDATVVARTTSWNATHTGLETRA